MQKITFQSKVLKKDGKSRESKCQNKILKDIDSHEKEFISKKEIA